MDRYLRTRIKTIYNVRSTNNTKDDAAPKPHARELRHNGTKKEPT
jgi:hypothetical protein